MIEIRSILQNERLKHWSKIAFILLVFYIQITINLFFIDTIACATFNEVFLFWPLHFHRSVFELAIFHLAVEIEARNVFIFCKRSWRQIVLFYVLQFSWLVMISMTVFV